MSTKRERVPESTSYNTMLTIGNSDNADKSISKVNKLLLLNGEDGTIREFSDETYALIGNADSIKSWSHPLVMDGKVYIDARPYTNRAGGIKLSTDFTFLKNRADLELIWATDPEVFTGITDVLVDVFASWLSGSLSRRLDLSVLDTNMVRVVAATYYLGLLHRDQDMDQEDTEVRLLRFLPRILRIPAQTISEILENRNGLLYVLYRHDTVEKFKIKDLALALNELTDDVYDITVPVLFNTMTRGTYIGVNSAETSGIAMSHVPTLAMIIYVAGQRGVQSRTEIGRIIAGVNKTHDFKAFNTFIENALGE